MVAFYKHHIAEWMDGTESLSDGAYRAYHVICQLIYLNEGPIVLNERGIAGRCNQRSQYFRRNIEELVAAGKLVINDGKVDNKRASSELQLVANNRRNASEGGVRSGQVRRNRANGDANALETHEAGEATLPSNRSLIEKTRQEKTREEKTIGADAPPSPILELGKVVDQQHAQAIIDHRKKIKKPLTAFAAKLLAGKLGATSDPNKAADMMIANGWQGFEPEWFEQRRAQGPPAATQQRWDL